MAPRITISERRIGDVTILDLHGRLVFDEGDTSCAERIDRLIKQGRLQIVVNLQDVSYIDSAGVGALVCKFVTLRKRGGDLKLLCLSDRVRHVISIAQLLGVFDSFESEELAVRSFAPVHPTAT
jgi:anti-sigma B factor antagonist